MSFIDHDCATCGHAGHRHKQAPGGSTTGGDCSGGTRPRCTCTHLAPGDVRIIPTFLPGTSVPTPIQTPGTLVPALGHTTCRCPDCVSYAQTAVL